MQRRPHQRPQKLRFRTLPLGFGVPDIDEALECAANRATLIGFGALKADQALIYRIPLPPSLERVTEPRSLTITLAWFSPIKPGHQSYRCARLEAAPLQPIEALGVERQDDQPTDNPVKRGTVFHEPIAQRSTLSAGHGL